MCRTDNDLLFGYLITAYGAVNDLSIASVCGTGCIYYIFLDLFTCCMLLLGNGNRLTRNKI